jgi:hypothetical protein
LDYVVEDGRLTDLRSEQSGNSNLTGFFVVRLRRFIGARPFQRMMLKDKNS